MRDIEPSSHGTIGGMRLEAAEPGHLDEMLRLARQRCRWMEVAELTDTFDGSLVALHHAVRAVGDDGSLLGWGILTHRHTLPPGRRGMRVFVRRDAEGRGLGGRIHAELRAAVDPGAGQLRTRVYGDDERSLAVARRWGFSAEQHSVTSRADLTTLEEPATPAGVTVEPCPLLQFGDADAVERMLAASQTNPEAAHGLVMTLATLAGFVFPGEVPVGALTRVDGRPAAISHGGLTEGILHLTYTGVDPAHRGRGLARVTKEHVHWYAAQQGATHSHTDNEEHNAGIRHVNEQLGYRPAYGVYVMTQALQA